MDGVGSGYSSDAAGHGQTPRPERGKPGAAMVRAGSVGPGTVAARHRDPDDAHEIDTRRRWVAPSAAQHARHSVPQRRGGCSVTREWRRKMRLNCTEERYARGSGGWFNGEEEQRGGQGLERPRVRTTCATWAQLAAGKHGCCAQGIVARAGMALYMRACCWARVAAAGNVAAVLRDASEHERRVLGCPGAGQRGGPRWCARLGSAGSRGWDGAAGPHAAGCAAGPLRPSRPEGGAGKVGRARSVGWPGQAASALGWTGWKEGLGPQGKEGLGFFLFLSYFFTFCSFLFSPPFQIKLLIKRMLHKITHSRK
jgi:hypothetical protein